MAMITCSECGREVSDKAASCPNCGAPISMLQTDKKFCKYCGGLVDKECVVCPKCGKQIEALAGNDKSIVINNAVNATSAANATSGPFIYGRPKDKMVALLLCIFLGFFGAHKFYEGKTGTGILYLFTMGLFGIGWFIDIISIALKPNPYYV